MKEASHKDHMSTTGQSIKTADQQYGVGREKNGNDVNRYGKKFFPLGGGVITAWNVSYIFLCVCVCVSYILMFFKITFKNSCRVGTLGLTKLRITYLVKSTQASFRQSGLQ